MVKLLFMQQNLHHYTTDFKEDGGIQKYIVSDEVYKTNISRRFRDWNLWIPRIENKPLERLRGNWVYTKLSFDNSDNSTLILNDLILTYYA